MSGLVTLEGRGFTWPKAKRGAIVRRSLPFIAGGRLRLVHRVRSARVYQERFCKRPHMRFAITTWCGACVGLYGFRDDGKELHAQPPAGSLVCARCEAMVPKRARVPHSNRCGSCKPRGERCD